MKPLAENGYCCVRFKRKSGKIDTTLTSGSSAVLTLWALQNTTSAKDSIVFSMDDGQVISYTEGSKDFPKVDYQSEKLGNIEDYCKGLFAEVTKNGK